MTSSRERSLCHRYLPHSMTARRGRTGGRPPSGRTRSGGCARDGAPHADAGMCGDDAGTRWRPWAAASAPVLPGAVGRWPSFPVAWAGARDASGSSVTASRVRDYTARRRALEAPGLSRASSSRWGRRTRTPRAGAAHPGRGRGPRRRGVDGPADRLDEPEDDAGLAVDRESRVEVRPIAGELDRPRMVARRGGWPRVRARGPCR